MPLELRLCGPFRLHCGNQPVTIPYLRARALLAYLALEPGIQPRERLADLFWPDQPQEAGRANLRRMLSLLRGQLGIHQAALVADRQGVCFQLPAGSWVDACELLAPPNRCRAACEPTYRALCIAEGERVLAGYGGPLLDGLSLPELVELEQWLVTRRGELQRQASALSERLSLCLERSGDLSAALRHAHYQVTLDPLDEAGQRRLMGLLLADGRPGAASAQYATLRQLLAAELGIAPAAATMALAERCRHAAAVASVSAAGAPARRPITVLCLRIPVDPTEIDGGAERVRTGLALCSEAVGAAGGTVGATVAGILVAYFGYPQVQEETARSALECALGLVGQGIAAGLERALVVSDPAIGLADVAGHVTRRALTLAGCAAAGEVVVGEALEVASRGWFQTRAQGEGAFQVVASSGAHTRLQAQPSQAPLLGRAQEQQRLAELWAEAQAGGGQLLLVRGEAGIGKSRLVAALATQVERRYQARCRPEWRSTPFRPLTRLLSEAWQIEPAAGSAACCARLAQRFPGWEPSQRTRLCELLIARTGPVPLPSPAHRHALLAELAQALGALAAAGPALLWLEDAHWADPSSLEVLALLVARPPRHLLTLVTARPEFRPPWPLPPLELSRLASAHGVALAEAVAQGRLSSGQLLPLMEQADGVPLFIEELVRARLAGHDTALPVSLEELLAARLGVVAQALPLAQLAATVGRRFTPMLLRAAGLPVASLETQLAMLVGAALVIPELAGAQFAFSHALVQEAAYRSMTANVRCSNHALIAQALLATDPAVADREPGLLAWHFGEAHDYPAAIRYASAAAQQATARCAHHEALQLLASALAALEQLPAGAVRDLLELEVRMHQGLPLSSLHGYGSEAARAAYARALGLAGAETDTPERFPLLWGLWLGSSSWSNFDTSLDLARRLVALAPHRIGDPYAAAHAYYALGNSLFCRGELATAAAVLEQGAATSPVASALSPYGEDPQVTNDGFRAWTYWFLGRDEEALAASRRSLERARAIAHPYSLGYALVTAGILHRLRGEVASVGQLAEEALTLGQQHQLALWQAAGGVMAGWAQAAAGDLAGLTLIEESVARARRIMGGVETMFLAHLADASERCGAWPLAQSAAGAGITASAARGDYHFQAEFMRIEAVARAAQGEPLDGCRQQLAAARAFAARQGAVALVARVTESWVRLSV